MDELRRHLDDEARRVETKPHALEVVRRRAGRRRVTRQIGTGALALALAGGGFALAVDAFSGPRSGNPLVGPTATVSPSPTLVVVAAPDVLREEAEALADRLRAAGYSVEVTALSLEEVPSHTLIAYAVDHREEAQRIIQEFLPGRSAEGSGYPGSEPPIEIRLAPSDYPEVTIRVRVVDGSGLKGAATAAATILNGEGYYLAEIREAGSTYSETFITCSPENEEAARRIRDSLFPKAEIRVEIPAEGHDVTIHIGRDFYDDYAGLSPG